MPVSGSGQSSHEAASPGEPSVLDDDRQHARRRSPARIRCGSRCCHSGPVGGTRVAELDVALRRNVDAALQRDGARRDGGDGRSARDAPPATKPRSTSTARPSSSLNGVTTSKPTRPRMHRVVDQDLVPRIELARERHRAKAPAHSSRRRRRAAARRRASPPRVICVLQRLLLEHPPVLPVAAVRQHGDRAERGDRGNPTRGRRRR